jgi:hypothetical protein
MRTRALMRTIGGFTRTSDGHNLGALCSMDTVARVLAVSQIRTLTDLGTMVMDAIERRPGQRKIIGAFSKRLEDASRAPLEGAQVLLLHRS